MFFQPMLVAHTQQAHAPQDAALCVVASSCAGRKHASSCITMYRQQHHATTQVWALPVADTSCT